jgi:serine/threonine protein phosphatase 1
MNRRLAVGDIHGAYLALQQVLHRAAFDEQTDILIGLGDYVDGWPDTLQVIEYLKQLPHFEGVVGNHDLWATKWLESGVVRWPECGSWMAQGGEATVHSYDQSSSALRRQHGAFLRMLPAYKLVGDKLFVHGGVELAPVTVAEQSTTFLVWDRFLFQAAASNYLFPERYASIDISPYKEIYLGHTSTSSVAPNMQPIMSSGVWMLDQGAGWEGKLTVMDIDTHEYWQSDIVSSLYPGVKGR